MKDLINIIQEKLKVSSQTKIDEHEYYPKNKDELKKLVKRLIQERGNKADLNDINTSEITDKWTIEYSVSNKVDVILNGLLGSITNIKLFNTYNDNISEILQMYPTNNTLLINDTARNILGMDGVRTR